jgi:hypothetical protein
MTHGATPEAVVVMGGGTKKSRNKKRGCRTWASSGAGALPPPFCPGPRVALALARPALHVVLEKRIHAPQVGRKPRQSQTTGQKVRPRCPWDRGTR